MLEKIGKGVSENARLGKDFGIHLRWEVINDRDQDFRYHVR